MLMNFDSKFMNDISNNSNEYLDVDVTCIYTLKRYAQENARFFRGNIKLILGDIVKYADLKIMELEKQIGTLMYS